MLLTQQLVNFVRFTMKHSFLTVFDLFDTFCSGRGYLLSSIAKCKLFWAFFSWHNFLNKNNEQPKSPKQNSKIVLIHR